MACQISYKLKLWKSTEALFQSMRFNDEKIIEEIREAENGYMAKQVAKEYRDKVVIIPGSKEDLNNMKLCLELKIKQHPELEKGLLATGDGIIIEDCTARGKNVSNLFWGAVKENEEWVGHNVMGLLWMDLRNKLKNDSSRYRA